MTQIFPPQDDSIFPPLPCYAIIYRAILRKSWIDQRNNRVTSAAFFRRPHDSGKDLDGLSVNIAAACSVEEVRSSFSECFGVVSLHVGRIRDIGLDVHQNEPKHANITGLPYQQDDTVNAERFAGLLAKQARFVHRI